MICGSIGSFVLVFFYWSRFVLVWPKRTHEVALLAEQQDCLGSEY